MQIETRRLSDIKPYPNNPRKNDNAVDGVAESIKQCGYCAPIIVDENGVILAGHTRLKALKKLGWKDAEVVVRDGLTEEQKKKYRLLDNKTGELALWDTELLQAELVDINFDGYDFGFEDVITPDEYGDEFDLPDGEKKPFRQMTFTLSDEQANLIERNLEEAKQGIDSEIHGNTNSNGNALFRVVTEWAALRK